MDIRNADNPAHAAPVPLVVVGGYLGSGKTSLINHLLRHAGGQRIAVLVNDFGAVSIDADLIEGASGNVLALAGGCVCCSFGEDLVGGLRQIVQRQPVPEVVVLECSGVGLPAAVARSAALVQEVQVEGIVVMVDASDVRQLAVNRYVSDTVQAQIAQADLLVLNHQDRCLAGQFEDCGAWLSTVAPRIPQVASQHGQVEPSLILGLKPLTTSAPAAHDAIGRWARAGNTGSGANPTRHPMQYGMRQLDAAVDPQTLAQEMIEQGCGRLLRAKGVVAGLDGRWWQLQIMGRRIDVRPHTDDSPRHGGQLVFIKAAPQP